LWCGRKLDLACQKYWVEKQLDFAKKFAKEKGVEDLVEFKINDFTSTDFEDVKIMMLFGPLKAYVILLIRKNLLMKAIEF
jgi:hypothetical protein